MLAAARTDGQECRIVLAWAATGVGMAAILWSGILPRVANRLAARQTSPWLIVLVGAALFVFIIEAVKLAAGLAATSLWPNGIDPVAYLAQTLSTLPLHVVVGALGLMVLWAVHRAAPHWGWVGLSAGAAVLIFGAVLIPPLAMAPGMRGDAPASGPAAASMLDFAHRGGLPADRLYLFDSADPNAVDMEGLGPFTHAAASRAALAAPRPETYAAVGHLLGHYRHKDLWSLALLWSAFATAFFFAVSKVLRSNRMKGALAPPMIGLIAWALAAVGTPVFNVFDQAINDRADNYALSLTHDPDALCRWLIATEASSKAEPSAMESLLFYDHPPLGARLGNALRWKPPVL